MSSQELMAYIAVFGGIALFTAVLTIVAVRIRRSEDAERLALRAAQVATQCKELLLGPHFLWAVPLDTAKAAAMKTLVRNARDQVVTTITVPSVPLDGVLKRFEFGGKQYEIRKASLMSNRTWLCEGGDDTVLLSADHFTFRTAFFRGDGKAPLFELPVISVLKRYRPVEAGEKEIGKVIIGLEQSQYIAIITLPEGRCSLLEQVFVLGSV